MGMISLLEQVTNEHVSMVDANALDITGERFGCGARSERERRACSLYLWLLGPTTEQLATNCPCRA